MTEGADNRGENCTMLFLIMWLVNYTVMSKLFPTLHTSGIVFAIKGIFIYAIADIKLASLACVVCFSLLLLYFMLKQLILVFL